MKAQVLWRKISRIVMMLADILHVTPERALGIFYNTKTCSMLHDSRYGLHLMSDIYILNAILQEWQEKK
mgnify:CR=1 FL=1